MHYIVTENPSGSKSRTEIEEPGPEDEKVNGSKMEL